MPGPARVGQPLCSWRSPQWERRRRCRRQRLRPAVHTLGGWAGRAAPERADRERAEESPCASQRERSVSRRAVSGLAACGLRDGRVEAAVEGDVLGACSRTIVRPTCAGPSGWRARRAIIVAKAIGTVTAAGWASSDADPALPSTAEARDDDGRHRASPPPTTRPATTPTVVRPRHQMPSSSIGQKVDAATANASSPLATRPLDQTRRSARPELRRAPSRAGTLPTYAAPQAAAASPQQVLAEDARHRDVEAGRGRQEGGEGAAGRAP